MYCAAVFTGPRLFIRIEGGIKRRQVLHDVLNGNLDSMYECVALEAIPIKAILHSGNAWTFYDQTDRALNRSLRRVTNVRRQEKYVTLGDGNVLDPTAIDDF